MMDYGYFSLKKLHFWDKMTNFAAKIVLNDECTDRRIVEDASLR
jgi:hypothetical protein